MKLKNKWNKYSPKIKAIIILFLLGLFFLITGMIMLISVRLNGIFSGFNMIHEVGVIESLKYYEPNNLTNLIFFKIGIIFTIFLMPIISGTSIILFVINNFF